MSVDFLQANVTYLIDQNPSTVTFTRTVRVPDPDTGGTKEEVERYGPVRVRIYETSALGEEDIRDVPGVTRATSTWRMLVPADADIPFSSFINDEFTIQPYGRFRLRAVVPLIQFGRRVATQVGLMRIGAA